MTNDIKQEPLYRPCVGIALFNHEGKVFAGERIDTPGAWQMPQGGIDPEEDIESAAFRELREETGTDEAEILKIMDRPLRYDTPPELRDKLQKIWGKPYVGQEQTWIAMRFKGIDSDIKLDAFHEPEFSRWQWTALAELPELIVPFKRETYTQVIAAFEPFTTPLAPK